MLFFRTSPFGFRSTFLCFGTLVAASWCSALFAQQVQSKSNGKTVDARNIGQRLIAVVPMIGSGRANDPIRPFGTPAPDFGAKPSNGNGNNADRLELPVILSFRYELSDDKKTALLEIVGRDSDALADLRNSKRADVKVFEPGKATKEEIQAEFRKYKSSFDPDKFGEDKFPEPKAPTAGGAK